MGQGEQTRKYWNKREREVCDSVSSPSIRLEGTTLPNSGGPVILQHNRQDFTKRENDYDEEVICAQCVQSPCSRRSVQIWSLACRAFLLPG